LRGPWMEEEEGEIWIWRMLGLDCGKNASCCVETLGNVNSGGISAQNLL
jgi:hypothetical protein